MLSRDFDTRHARRRKDRAFFYLRRVRAVYLNRSRAYAEPARENLRSRSPDGNVNNSPVRSSTAARLPRFACVFSGKYGLVERPRVPYTHTHTLIRDSKMQHTPVRAAQRRLRLRAIYGIEELLIYRATISILAAATLF